MKKEGRKSKSKLGLDLKWCMGFNYDIMNSVINLTTREKKEFFFVSGHFGVIYDYQENTQRLFQGHTNQITSVCYNENQKIIVTADQGEGCMMIVWS